MEYLFLFLTYEYKYSFPVNLYKILKKLDGLNFKESNLWDQRNQIYEFKKIPKWCTDCIKMLLFIVYFYSGLAKINSDWLLEAQPLKIWLTSSYDLPIIGSTLMQQNWVHYGMSWGGMFYDLLIAFLLLYSRTRITAFCLVIFFHVFTAILFPIGMFPYIMIVGSLIFFDPQTHNRMIKKICHRPS